MLPPHGPIRAFVALFVDGAFYSWPHSWTVPFVDSPFRRWSG